MKKKLFFILFICAGFLTANGDAVIQVIKEPGPKFHGIGTAKTLKLTASVEEIDDENLPAFAKIRSAAVDRKGNFYIFDYKLGTVVKLDSNLKFLTSIGSLGEGPGEFKLFGSSFAFVNVGLDGNLYFANLLQRKILKFKLSGKYIDEYRVDNFKPFRAVVDAGGNCYLPSLKDYLIDVYDPDMKLKKSLVPRLRRTFLYYKPQPCVIHRERANHCYNLMYDILGSGDIALIDNFDLSVMIVDPINGKIKKKFYAWEDFLLSEYKAKLYRSKKKNEEKPQYCAYCRAFSAFFIDTCDNLVLTFIDSHLNTFLYKFSSQGDFIQVYKVDDSDIDGVPHFFYFKDDRYYAYSNYGIHVFEEVDQKAGKTD